jgi:hypothetical protein
MKEKWIKYSKWYQKREREGKSKQRSNQRNGCNTNHKTRCWTNNIEIKIFLWNLINIIK